MTVTSTSPFHVIHFKHDCDVCVFLGHVIDRDMYYCPESGTVLSRWSSKGDEYISGRELVDYYNELKIAENLARSFRLID